MSAIDNNQLAVADTVAAMVTRLRSLGIKSRNDDQIIATQRQQISELTEELTTVEHNSRFEIAELQRERDEAINRANRVQEVIDKLGNDAIAGMRAIRGNQTPPVIPNTKTNASLADRDDRLPKVAPIR